MSRLGKVELPDGEEAFTVPDANGGNWLALRAVEPPTEHTFADIRAFVSED
jgi:hypothetical protein